MSLNKDKVDSAIAETASAAESPAASENELISYEEAIRTLAEARSPYVFQNDNIYHAAIVLKTMIEFADNEIAIFDDSLNGDVSEKNVDFNDTLRAAIERDSKSVRIVVENREADSSSGIQKMLRELSWLYPNSISVKIASEDFKRAAAKVRTAIGVADKIHFAATDTGAYRIELPYKSRKAYCSFKGKTVSSMLIDVFDTHFEACEDYFAEQAVAA